MPIHTRLRDLYCFPGFQPAAHIHGRFGDPYAVVIPLRRVAKKRPAELAALSIEPSTTSPFGSSATSRPAADAFTSTCRSAASHVVRVKP